MRTFFLKACSDLFAGRAVNAFVGDVLFPSAEEKVLLGQGLEASPFERVAANVGHFPLHLPLGVGSGLHPIGRKQKSSSR